jgi:biopolymer transport protein ExbD
MLERSLIKNHVFGSPMLGQSSLKPRGSGFRRSLMFTLTLTSLIDAFTIIVIYLLVNFGNPATLKVNGDIQLPQAIQNDQLSEGTVISVNNGRYFIDDKELTLSDVTKQLIEIIQAKPDGQNLIIQADKKTDYATLSPLILAGSQAGFHQFKFAVVQGDSK